MVKNIIFNISATYIYNILFVSFYFFLVQFHAVSLFDEKLSDVSIFSLSTVKMADKNEKSLDIKL